jgi:hypothetical protein
MFGEVIVDAVVLIADSWTYGSVIIIAVTVTRSWVSTAW